MHPRQPTLEVHVEEVWLAALTDAEIDPDDALLFVFNGVRSEVEGLGAVTWPAGRAVDPEGSDITSVLASINHEECIDAVRVGLWAFRPIEATAALLRHELEHVHQFTRYPELEFLHQIAEDVVRRSPESGKLYNEMPTESEANAAGALFTRGRYGDATIDALLAAGCEDAAALRAPITLPSRQDLPERMLRFLAAYPDLCEGYFPRFHILLNQQVWRGAGDLWKAAVAERT